MNNLLVAPFSSLFLHFRLLLLDLLDSALNAWNLVDLVESLQRDSKYLHIDDSVVEMSLNQFDVSAMKHCEI